MLKHKGTYEIMSPEDIGLQRADESGLVLGKLRCVWSFAFESHIPFTVSLFHYVSLCSPNMHIFLSIVYLEPEPFICFHYYIG